MGKLRLYISKSTRERVRLVDINGEDHISGLINDMHAIVSLVDYPVTSKTVFYIVENVTGGYCIHIIRTIPPTRPHYLDATIFVSNNCDILSEELSEVVSTVTQKVLASAVTEADMNELRDLFATDYDSCDKVKKIKPSKGSMAACLHYGDTTGRSFDDILADGLYNPQWSNYRCVVIMEDELSMFDNTAVSLDVAPEENKPTEREDERSNDDAVAKTYRYMFSLPMSVPDGRTTLEFEVESTKPFSRSPISGYDLSNKPIEGEGNVNSLRRSHGDGIYGRFGRLIWGLCGVLIGVVAMMLVSLFHDEPNRSEHEKTVHSKTAEARQAVDAIAYLDNNRIWRRQDMEAIEGLQGLFDDMNEYRFDMLCNKWANTLNGSKSFAKVVNAAQKAIAKKVDPRRDKEHDPNYNHEGDFDIGWLGYTYWIDP